MSSEENSSPKVTLENYEQVFSKENSICGNADGNCVAMNGSGSCEDCLGTGKGYEECIKCEGNGHYYMRGGLSYGYDPEDSEAVAFIEENNWLQYECFRCEGWGIVCGSCDKGYCAYCL
jgi:hypothetical protein